MIGLKNYLWQCTWTSHLGCLKAATDNLGIPVTLEWLFGGTAHAFIINMHNTGCPSGPTAWRTQRLSELGHNLGYCITSVFSSQRQKDFSEKQRRAYDTVKYALERGFPCYGWELEIPEYYCITAYDEIGYYYSGPTTGEAIKGPLPWQELGTKSLGMLEVYYMEPGFVADDKTLVREALQFALEHSQSPNKWAYPDYESGLAAYDIWLAALTSPKSDIFGLAYNSAVWHECRHFAVLFLQEVEQRLGQPYSKMVRDAQQCYEEVRDSLAIVKSLYPFPPQAGFVPDIHAATVALKKARSAEERGLTCLETLVSALS